MCCIWITVGSLVRPEVKIAFFGVGMGMGGTIKLDLGRGQLLIDVICLPKDLYFI